MNLEMLEKMLLRTPLMGRCYRDNAASLKRALCLRLHRLGLLRPYSFVQWLVTNRCNLSCPFCEASAGGAAPGELSTEEALRLVDDLPAAGVKKLILSGGEPLMRPDIGEIMARAVERGLKLGLVTNGWHVPDMADALAGLPFFLYFTSLDGTPSYHDRIRGREHAFERAMLGLELFTRMGVPVRIVNTAVHPGNISQLEELAKIVKGSGATSWRLTPVSGVGRATGKADYELDGGQLRFLAGFIAGQRRTVNCDFGESHTYLGCFSGDGGGKPFFCGAGLTRCSITAEGEVMGCQQIFDTAFSEGNVRDKGFPRIWREGFARFRNGEAPAGCRQCAHLAGCGGGCWAEMERRGSCLKAVWERER
jgi:radical SAM protein with 4Fe4S-binding SPASM domain